MFISMRTYKGRTVSACHKESEVTVNSCFGRGMIKELHNSLKLKEKNYSSLLGKLEDFICLLGLVYTLYSFRSTCEVCVIWPIY